ncbi:Ornithine carbamoyltransferase (plasmid) [Sinorhizobium sojae CCBAU 05684]|uniref:Ornithine carbamoyltransferase n=1 Tax=Sinorhizobium sojae CCBAU 05684 TaxID=716928 RepID=A0A249PJ67_9HYPH|nr:ornithine carbamoyltransferase [Sinorhizobium sojae]ASY65787.1 Ornithine carbamoyltransferase [Sinorhizobium sojae CCBAU 05684]
MPINIRGRSVLTLEEFTPDELRFLLRLAADLKTEKRSGKEIPRLSRKHIALIFEKESTRTRTGFEVAAHDQGAHVTYWGPSGSHLGHRESIRDTARVLGRLYDAIEYRGRSQGTVDELAAHAGVPVYNGLTDESHPTHALGDFLTMQEFSEKPLSQVVVAYLGDGRGNVARSLAIGAAKLGVDLRIVFATDLLARAILHPAGDVGGASAWRPVHGAGARRGGVLGADFIYTAPWLGEEETGLAERIRLLAPFGVRANVMEASENPHTKFMHCLPACHDRNSEIGARAAKQFGIECMEVSDAVFQSKASIVFDQAENRMHTIKSILIATIAG